MIDITRLKQVYATLQKGGYSQDFGTFRKGFAGNENYANRKKVYDLLSANGAQIGKTYEEFMQNMQKPKSMGNPTVNKYRQQMFNSVDPTKNKASELTRKAVKTAHKAMDNVRKPVRGAVVNKQGKKVKEFDITPAKTLDDLNREYAHEVASDWEKEQQRQSLYNTTRSLDEVQRKIAERDAQLDEADNGFWTGIRHAAQGMNVTGGMFQQYDDDIRKELIDPKYKQYLVEANYLTQMKKQLIQEEEDAAAPNATKWDRFKHASSSFTSGMLDEAFGSDAFDFGGYNKIRESDVLLRISDRINRGVATDDDRRLLQILKDKEEIESRLDNDAYSFGRGVSQSAGFVTDFLITGGGDFGGLGRLGGKMALGLARKTFAKTMTKDLGKRFAAWSLKNLGKTLGEATGAAMTATSVQVGKTAANATQRYLGLDSDDGGLEYDKDGNLKFKGGTDVGTAIAKAIASGTIENYTELLGPHITSMGKRLFGWAGVGLEKITPDALSKFFDKVGSSELFKRIGTFTDEIANSKVLNAGKKALANVGVNDMPEEGLEEEAGIILNSLITGDNKFSDLWDKETQYKTWGGVMSMMGAMRAIPIAHSAVGTAYSASKNKVEYFKCKHDLTKAETLARQALGDKWTPIKELIDNADNKHIIEVGINIIRQSDKYSQEQAKAAQNYIGQLLKMRGFNNATMASIRDKNAKGEGQTDADKEDIEVSNSYAEGHEAEGELRHLIQLEYEKRTANLAKRLGLTPEKIDAMNVDSFSSYIGLNSDADFDIFQYKKAKAAYDGVMDNAQNLVDIAGEVAAQRVDNMTNVHDGTIRKAYKKCTEMNPDSPVYIISGNIKLNDDGSINYTDSDKMLVVYDEETGQREAIGNFMLASVDPNMQNAEEVKAQAIQSAKQKIITEQSNVIDGILAEGSEFTMESNDGSSHNYKIVQVDEQGNCIVSVDGTVLPEPLSLDAIQQQYDQSNVARSIKNDQTAQESEQTTQEPEQTTQEPEQIQQESQPIEDNFDYDKITNENDGKVKRVDVTDEEGKNRFPNAKAVFLIQDKGAMPKFVVMDEEGNLTSYVGKRGDKIHLKGEMTIDEYKKQRQEELQLIAAENADSSMIEDNSGTIEADRGGIEAENNESLTFEDGTPIPVDMNGEVDLSQADAAHAAEWYDNNLGEDADDWLDGEIKKAKKVLEQAKNKKLAGTKPSELVSSKKEKEAAIADAQAHYDSAISIRDSLKERRIAKEENTSEGRRNLIEKARRKFARLKSAVKDDAEVVAQIYKETVGSLLHRLYDGTGIDVTDTIPLTAEEYVASNLGAHSLNYEGTETSKSVKQETGLSREDFAKTQLLAADGKGTTIDALVHSLWENRPSNLDSLDTQDIRNALIGVLTSGFKASEARSFIENIRIAQAEKLIEEERTAAENAAYYEQQKAKEEEEKKKAELEKKAEDEKKKAEENIDLPAIDKQGEPINNNIIELAKWAKKQGLEIDSTSKLNSYADLFLMCKDGFGVSTLVPDEGKNINQVIYFPDNAEVIEQLGKLQEEFNAGRDLNHSSNIDSEITEGATFYDAATAKEFRDFVNEQTKFPDKLKEGSKAIEVPEDATDEKPLGEQRTDSPFSARKNGKQQTEAERAADVEKNKVDDVGLVDAVIGEKIRKSFERIAKMMGAKIQYQRTDKLGNGWIQETTDADGNVHRTIFITLDSSITEGAQFIFGHEMTHQIKSLNPAAYNELTQLVLDTYGSDAFDKAVDETMLRYSDAGFSGRARDYYAEEVVADAVGEMIRDLNLAHTLAMKMSHPLLAAIHEILQKIKLAFFGTEYSDVTKNIIRSIEQAYVKTAKGEVTNSETGEDVSFSLRLKSAIEETETNPSDAQKESGNYKKGHIKFGGYDYTIENPKGSTRSGKDANGKEWKVTMHDTYGYIRGKFGKDGDHLDMFINDKADLDNWDGDVFVVDQVNPDGSFDEHKVMYGYDSMDDAEKAYLANYSKGWKGLGNITGVSKDEFDKWLDTSKRKLKPFKDYAKVKFSLKDNQGNPLNQDGTLKLDKIKSVDELTDEDFLHPTRNVELPSLPKKIADAIGTEGKPVVIKKNIFERNYMRHKDVTPELSKVIFKSALYNPDLYGQNQKKTRPYNWVLINTKDEKGNNRTVLLEVNPNKDNVEIVHWHFVNDKNLGLIKKQAIREGDQVLILPSEQSEEVGGLSNLTDDLSAAKIDNSSETAKENGEKFSLKDDEYLKAVENGDMEKAQKMVNEAAEAAGYSTDSSYQGTSAFNGSAPWGNGYFLTKEERKEAWDNDEYDGDQTLGDYIHRGIDAMNLDFIALDPRNYRAADPMRKEAIDNVRNAIQKKSETITMYRSVPSDVKEGSFRNGDWVTPSRAYAVENAKVHGWGDNFNIIEQKVPVDEIWWDGNDIAEWGYGREEDYVNDTDFAYKNTKNNRKLLDAVTYDDNGNVIPLSQRFNENNADVRYSLKDEKTMFGMHNISLDKLRKAIKQGGFAAPSMGVIDSKNGIYSGYGEITLIPKAEKIAKRTGKNIGTYAADAWTPIYPPVEKKFGGNGGDVAYDDIESVPKEMQSLTRNAINSFMDGRDTNSLAYLYLHEKGKAPELVHVEGKYPKELHDEVKGILGKLDSIYSTTDEQKEKLLDLFIREVYDGNREEFDNDIKNFIKKDEEFIKKRPNSNIAKNKQLDVDWMKEHGYDYGALSRFVDGILRDAETSGKVDENATMKAAQQYIQDNGMKEDFDSWKEKLNDRYNVEEVIFAGYKPDGNRKYLPNTVENAVKVMKQDGKNASVGSASFSHFVASILKPMGTLDQIRKKKGNLTGNYEDVEKFQEKWQPVYDELADKMQPDAEPFESYGMDRLEDAATQKNPKKYAKDEYGVDLTDEDIDKLNELIDAVKNEKPSIYFETKFMRPYGLDEFEKAIVPNDTPSDVVDALKKAGIDVSSYERGNAEDRQKVTMDAINSSDNIRFSLKAMMEKPEGWKQANKKAIHIAEAIERDPKFSLKNLDGTLIKAGTYFSGGGLVEEGLKGIIDPVVAVEYDEKISGVYRNNFGQHIVTADVRDVDPKELVKQIDGEVEYFHASPVCKNYSQAKSNHAELELDKETAASTAEFINAIKPKVVTIENVKGYKDSEAMKTITDALDANGYTWDADVYNAADYGGYTNRERLIVRAVRDGKLPDKPKKMARKSGWYEAVADIIPTLTEKKNGVAPWMDIRLKADGIDWRNIDKPLYVMGSAYADGKIPHAFADELLPTLRTKSGDVIVMPDGKVYRAMGRVLARVSGVSDDYKMPFSENLSHTIIGNGIPTQLTEHVIAPLLQNTLRPTTPEDGNTKFSLRGSTPYDKQMEEWMEKNHLEKGAVPMEKPVMKEGENIFDYANRMVEWTRNQNLWKTAPKQTGFQDALDKWKADNGLSPDAYPPVRPHRENYSTEIGYTEDLEEYNKKKELWKSTPKPKDFDLSVDLEDMNKQLRNIRRAVLNQKNYDQRTIKAVSDLVRKMLNIGWGDGLSRGNVVNLLSAAKNATGANDVKKYLDKAMGILAENYLNRLSTAYDNLINTKGARADQSGVIKMGSLDANGQAFMSEYKKAINMDDKSLNNYVANIEEDSAKNEDNVEMNDYRLAGIQAAIMYKQQIGGNDADIAELQRQIGELKNKKDATKEDKDLLKSLEKKLFENKFDRITMYENLLNNIQRMVKESKGRAKEFREEIAEHKNEILHLANLDLEGVDSTYYDTTNAKKKLVNNDLQRAVFSSTYTFEQFLKFFGKKAANGEGRLYNYFTKLNQDALDEEQLYNEMNRNALDEKTKELFGKKKFMNLVGIDGNGMKEMDIEVTDYSNKKTGKRTIHLKQGQMLYIYLVNKETDGEMKLRAMGITEEDVAAIEENLDPRVKAMGEWLQDEYLPECQRRYQATHTKYFGAPMKEVENYFPLAINNRARNVKEDVNQDSDVMSQLAGTSTGAIVTRRVNVIPLDIENADAFEVAFNHLQEMEEWSAMLPFRQDINTLLSYTHFRNQVQNMSSVAYGSGKTLWDEFKQTAQIAAGTYKPKVNAGMMDSRIAAAMGGIAVAKISGRLWTAIKQSQSATVFLPECDFIRFVKNGVNPYGSWKWAMENIPDFRKRVENMTYGDVKLRQYLDELEKWHDWTKTISKIGMAPNILVDGITCAVGARSVYETEVNRLTKLGYPKEKAEEKAYYKAVAAYNKTQQSSGGMYLSPMQVDRTYVSAALSLFKNANYAYGRMQIEACRGLARTYDFWGGKHKTTLIESMTRQIMEEDGLDENTARAIAKATYNRTFRQSIGRLINFATLVPVSWALYKVLPYLLTGDDDDKKKDMIEEAVIKGFATSLSDNYVIPFASNILNAGLKVEDGKPTFDPEVFRYQNLYINPATSDLANIYSMIGNQKWYSVANKLGMLGVQSLIGFNPETVGALYQAFAEADNDDGNVAKEWQIGILKAISAPEESIRELYMDELGLKSGDIKKIPLAELEKRYAERQINRDNLLSQIGMDAETFNGYVDKYQKSFEKKIKDKMDKWDEYDKKKADEFFDTTSDPKLKDMIEKKRAKDANAAADEQIAKEGLNQEKKGKEPSEEAYDAVKMSIDVAEDNAISTYNKVLNKRYAALNDEYNNQTDAMKYIFMSKHPNFKAYNDLESEYTTYGKKMKELKEKLVSADGYDAKQTILKQIRAEREKFSELQSKVR